MTVQPDSFFPGEFTLSDGPVVSIQTSAGDPKVVMDNSGVTITDSDGDQIVGLTGNGLDLIASPFSALYEFDSRRSIKWEKDAHGGGLVASIGAVTGGIENRSEPPTQWNTSTKFDVLASYEGNYADADRNPITPVARAALRLEPGSSNTNGPRAAVVARTVLDDSEDWTEALILDGSGDSDFLYRNGAINQPNRVVNGVYNVDPKRPALVTVELSAVGSTVTTGIEILIGPTNPPLPDVHISYLQSDTPNARGAVSFILPANWFYYLRAANGAPTVESVTENVL